MKYTEYKGLDLPKIATEVLTFWEDNEIFQQSIDTRKNAPTFTFFEGPPSANGTPGIHHVMARAVKDIFCRYKTQKGFLVKRKGGWDTHGLPVELQVEKELGITKDDIGKTISIEDYNNHCKQAVMKYTALWNDVTTRMGYWVDLEKPYVTYEAEYIESVWFLLKTFFNKDLLYKGYTIQPYSPAAGTGLSSHELNQPGTYRNVKDTSIVAQFKVDNTANSELLFKDAEAEVFFLAWTTTPWTLPSNTALAIGKNITYVKVRTFNPYTFLKVEVILAKALLGKYFSLAAKTDNLDTYTEADKIIPYTVVAEYKGEDLVGITYQQLMPYVQPKTPAFRVIIGDFVSTEDGTGIVHIAPTFGADDFRAAQQAGIPAIMITNTEGDDVPLVDKTGRFVSQVTDYAGMYVKNYNNADENAPDYKSTDVLISIKLKTENKAFKVEKYEHSYPHCWRTDKPILYYPMESWFIRTTAYKEKLVELNNTINWKPASTGTGRFGNWLENLVDWNLTRSRFWGTPLPIWVSEDGKTITCIGSIAELKEGMITANNTGLLSSDQVADNVIFLDQIQADTADLHRPYVDKIFLTKDGQVLKREPDLIDVWFDSGAMPYAQWHFPFSNTEDFNSAFPADFIAEGVDQTRGWFFTLHAISTMLFDSVAFKNVIANGLVLDKLGNKMSKRLGNAVDPFITLDTYGADATRWYMIGNANPWENLKFNEAGITEVQRKYFGTLYNTYSFFALYANLDGFVAENGPTDTKHLTDSDRWVLSLLNTTTLAVDRAYEDYDATLAVRILQDFVNDDVSNWYVRLNRKRFWKGEFNEDKKAAYQTLYTCLITISRLMAPVAPFFAERLFKDLTANNAGYATSVHLESFPQENFQLIDTNLEAQMALAKKTSSLVHSIRKKHNLKVRQPLSRLLIPVLTLHDKHAFTAISDLVLSETNIKTLEIIDDTTGLIVKKAKPNFKKLGAIYGPKLKDVAALITGLNQDDINRLDRGEGVTLPLDNGHITLTRQDVEISSEDIPGWLVASEGGVTVALDVNLTPALKQEGYARELVSKIQTYRKDLGFDVLDKININIQTPKDPDLEIMLSTFGTYVCQETQALAINVSLDRLDNGVTFDLDGASLIATILKF